MNEKTLNIKCPFCDTDSENLERVYLSHRGIWYHRACAENAGAQQAVQMLAGKPSYLMALKENAKLREHHAALLKNVKKEMGLFCCLREAETVAVGGMVELLSNHHSTCPKHNQEAVHGGAKDTKDIIVELICCIENWAAQEDGIPEDMLNIYQKAKFICGSEQQTEIKYS